MWKMEEAVAAHSGNTEWKEKEAKRAHFIKNPYRFIKNLLGEALGNGSCGVVSQGEPH